MITFHTINQVSSKDSNETALETNGLIFVLMIKFNIKTTIMKMWCQVMYSNIVFSGMT